MGEPEQIPGKTRELRVGRRPEEVPEAEARPEEARPRAPVNPSVAIAVTCTLSGVLMVASVALWASAELGSVVPWIVASLTILGIGLGITSAIWQRGA